MYRAVVQPDYNAEDLEANLKMVSKHIPIAAPGHVVVNVTIRPVNPADWFMIRDRGFAASNGNPETPGCEGFGIVKAIGEGVTTVKPGQRVVPVTWPLGLATGNGSWQEYVCLTEDLIIPVPDSVSDEDAAQLIVNPWTAMGMITAQDIPKGEYLIQTAAGSTVGRIVIQVAKYKGIKTINIVRRPEHKEELFALGADEVICSTTEDIAARVKEITSGKLAYGAFDCVGGELTKAVAASVRNNGQVFVYGALGSYEASVGIMDLFRGVSVRGWLGGDNCKTQKQREAISKETFQLIEEKALTFLIGEKFDLADFRKAIKKSETAGRDGKVLLIN